MYDQSARDDLSRDYDELYERFGRPLERDHRGEYVVISPRGDVALGKTMQEAAQQGATRFGPGCLLYKVGARAVGRWR